MDPAPAAASAHFLTNKSKFRFFGLTFDDCVRVFFGGNAVVSVIVLTLITIFLFREGAGFFGQNKQNLVVYRRAGLEYIDFIRAQQEGHTALTRYLSDVRLRQFKILVDRQKMAPAAANAALASFDDFAGDFSDAVQPMRALVSDLTEVATAIKTKFTVMEDKKEERQQLLAVGRAADADKVVIAEVDFAEELKPILGTLPAYREAVAEFQKKLETVLAATPQLSTAELQPRLDRFKQLTREFIATFPVVEKNLETWDFRRPVPWWKSITSFLFGREWLTASFWQDWYGIVPLFVGSLMVSLVALLLAVPF